MASTGPRIVVDGEDGIDDQLTGAVVGHVATTVGDDEGCADFGRVHEDVRGIRPDTERKDVGVLENEEVVVVGAPGQALLEVQRLGVGNRTDPAYAQYAVRRGPARARQTSRARQ